jgi:DNA-directed RNA polymerase specialized sigma24 family protein
VISDEATETNPVDRVPDASGDQLDSIWEAEWQQHLIALATERLKCQVSDAQFQIFDLHVLRGWPGSDVAQTLGVSVAQVYLAKLRAGRRFKREIDAVKVREETGELF